MASASVLKKLLGETKSYSFSSSAFLQDDEIKIPAISKACIVRKFFIPVYFENEQELECGLNAKIESLRIRISAQVNTAKGGVFAESIDIRIKSFVICDREQVGTADVYPK